MAGRNHHFIPQLLQKGFSARQTRSGKHQVWFYQQGRSPSLTGIRNLFAERDFYGPPPTPSVDQLITDDETSRFDQLMNDLRAVTSDHLIGSSPDVSDFVHQVSIRVRWIRSFFESAGKRIISRAAAGFRNSSWVTKQLEQLLNERPGWVQEIIAAELEKQFRRPLTADEQSKVATLCSILKQNPEMLLAQMNFRALLEGIDQLHAAMDSHAEAGHLKGLERSLGAKQTTFREFLRELHWSVLVAAPHTFLLGDCGPIHFREDGAPIGPMGTTNGRDQVASVALPISNAHLLVGGRVPVCAALDADLVNRASAAWSRDAFIASEHSEKNLVLQALINSRLDPYLDAELELAFGDS